MVKLPNQDVKDYLHFDKLAALRELLSPACSRLTGESACPTEQSSTRAAPEQHHRSKTGYGSAITGFTSSPTPAILTVTSSPGLRYRGGWRAKPTPAGVPVAMMSPGSRIPDCRKAAVTP